MRSFFQLQTNTLYILTKQKLNMYLSVEIYISENNSYVKTTQNSLQPQNQQAHRTQPVAAPHQGSGSCCVTSVPLWVCCAKLQRESKSSTAQTQQHNEHKGQTLSATMATMGLQITTGLVEKELWDVNLPFLYTQSYRSMKRIKLFFKSCFFFPTH